MITPGNVIGDVELPSPFLMAPLAGFTDNAVRTITLEFGAGLVYSEMVSAKGLIYEQKNTEELLDFRGADGFIAIQIFGSDPDAVAHGIQCIENKGNAIVDINMGCPMQKIVKSGSGAALMKRPDIIYDMVKDAVKITQKPVTAKIRIGWDNNNINAVDCAKAIESAGASAVAVHGRTAKQKYEGSVNRDVIASVKQSVSIPVIGNGDIKSAKEALEFMDETGCDMVMIGRGAIGKPWIFKSCNMALSEIRKGKSIDEITEYEPCADEILNTLKKLIDLTVSYKGEKRALLELRKKLSKYLKNTSGVKDYRKRLYEAGTKIELMGIIYEYCDKLSRL